jgi:sensor protein resE
MMSRALVLGMVALMALILGMLVLKKSKRHYDTKQWFFLVCLCLAVWSAGLEMFSLADNGAALDIASRWFYVASAVFCPALAIFTAKSFLPLTKSVRSFIFISSSLFIVLSIYIILAPEFIINASEITTPVDFSQIPINAVNYIVFATFFSVFFLVVMWFGYVAWRKSDTIRRKQVAIYMTGLLVSSIPGFVVDLLLPALGDYRYVWVGPVAIILFLFAIMYSIVKYRLMDVKTAVARSVSYMLLLIALAVVYIISAYVISIVIFQRTLTIDSRLNFMNMVLAILLAFLYQPIKRFFNKLTDRVFYYGEYDADTFAREISKILTYTADLQLLTRRVGNYIASSLKAEKVAFCIPEKGIYGRTGRRRLSVVEEDVRRIMDYYYKNCSFPEVILANQVKDPELKKLLDIHRTKIVIPLLHQNQETGILFLGEHKSLGYSSRDIEMLESIAGELAVSIRNSLSMEEINELNKSLQRRIDEATKELRFSNRQLQRLDEAKNEFISMASHQLRTPLTSIKGYLDMMLEGDLGKISPTQRAVLREAFSSSERMVRLINDFLNVSRLQTGKFTIDKQSVDIAQILRDEVSLLKVVADQRSVEMVLKIDKKIPSLAVDSEKIRQVMLNMIDNAIYYSNPHKKVVITLKSSGKMIEFSVKDSGIGVPKSEQTNLFGKFFRGTNAKKRRPDGTGVGLFLAKKVILSHDGEMIFESEEGKGSTFGFRLPVR